MRPDGDLARQMLLLLLWSPALLVRREDVGIRNPLGWKCREHEWRGWAEYLTERTSGLHEEPICSSGDDIDVPTFIKKVGTWLPARVTLALSSVTLSSSLCLGD